MTYCPTYVHSKEVLHKLMKYSDYSMDHLATAICHPWLSTKSCHWSPFPFTFPVKIAHMLASLGCWRSGSLQGEIHKGEQMMKRHWEDKEKREFLKVALGSECEDLIFWQEDGSLFQSTMTLTRGADFFSRTIFLEKCSYLETIHVRFLAGREVTGKEKSQEEVLLPSLSPIPYPQGWGHSVRRPKFNATLASSLVT